MTNALRRTIFAFCWILLPALFAQQSAEPAETAELIAPAFRAERHFAAGADYLRALPDGTQVRIERSDGAALTLSCDGEALTTTVPRSSLDAAAGVVTTPLGFRVEVVERKGARRRDIRVTAPNGSTTLFSHFRYKTLAREGDGFAWTQEAPSIALRLSDGTRIDVSDEKSRLEVMTLHGERFRIVLAEGDWQELPPSPAPPLIPDMRSYYLAGNGDDWRLPAHEDHLVFAWAWYPYPLRLARAIKDIESGHRRNDLNFFFNGLDRVQPPAELGAYLLGRRLGLGGGDRMTLEIPGQDPFTVFVLPGPLDPDYIKPKQMPTGLSLTPRRVD